MFNIFGKKYMEKEDGKYTNPEIQKRSINKSGMFGIINETIYKAIYKQTSGDECVNVGFFQKIYNSLQKGIFTNVFEISCILILIGGIFEYTKGFILGTNLPFVLLSLVILNIFFILISFLSMYVKYLIREPILDKDFTEIAPLPVPTDVPSMPIPTNNVDMPPPPTPEQPSGPPPA
jgi:hypothetical protein